MFSWILAAQHFHSRPPPGAIRRRQYVDCCSTMDPISHGGTVSTSCILFFVFFLKNNGGSDGVYFPKTTTKNHSTGETRRGNKTQQTINDCDRVMVTRPITTNRAVTTMYHWGRRGLFKHEGAGTQLRSIKVTEDKETQVNYIRRGTRGRNDKTWDLNRKTQDEMLYFSNPLVVIIFKSSHARPNDNEDASENNLDINPSLNVISGPELMIFTVITWKKSQSWCHFIEIPFKENHQRGVEAF